MFPDLYFMTLSRRSCCRKIELTLPSLTPGFLGIASIFVSRYGTTHRSVTRGTPLDGRGVENG
jgi:hypothetical protein